MNEQERKKIMKNILISNIVITEFLDYLKFINKLYECDKK